MPSFVSTRGSTPKSFAEALFQGLAEDGGLYVPEEVSRLPAAGPPRPDEAAVGSAAEGAAPTRFAASARWAAQGLLGDSLAVDLRTSVVDAALDFEAPLVEVEPGLFVLELFHGPSLAFKDVGARFMARAMAALDDSTVRGSHPRTVLVATSGDTGGAVASAFHGVAGTRVVVLFPRDGISDRQRRQTTTLGGNVMAVGVDGTFDDCQRLAKAAFADEALSSSCRLTSANSINIGRLIPQAFYYVHAASTLGWAASPPTFVVPSGNLGNLCAGLLAHRAGLPAAGFVAASNANRVFPDYLEHERFEPRPSMPTASNAMDVGDPSNLERIRWLYGDDVAALRDDVTAISCDDDETEATIADVHRRTGYVLDPHGAVAYCAAQRAGLPGDGPAVVLATAHPAKFPEIVEEATGQTVPLPETLADRMHEPEHWVEIADSDSDLRRLLMNQDAP